MTRGTKPLSAREDAVGEAAPRGDPRRGLRAAHPAPERRAGRRLLLEPVEPPTTPNTLAWVGGLAAAVATFALDLATPNSIVASTLYVATVLMLLGARQRGAVIVVTLLCTVLTVTGAFVSATNLPVWQVATNRAFALVAIWSVALFGLSRQRVRDRLHEQQERLRITLDSIGDAVIATDVHGRVSFLNAEAEALTRWTSAQAVGRPLGELFTLIHEETGEPVQDPVAAALTEGTVRLPRSTLLSRADGSGVAVTDSAAPIRGADGRRLGVVMVLQDVSARVAEERTSRFLADLGRRLVGCGESREAVTDALRATVKHFDAGYGALAESPDAEATTLEVALDLDGPGDGLPWPALSEAGRSRVAAGLPLLIGDCRNDPVTAEMYDTGFQPLHWRSLAVLPLGAGSALWLAGREPRAWSAVEGRVLRSAADLLALASESGRTMDELRRAQRSRDDYLAMLAHELRGPMAPMRTDLSILAEKIDPLSEAERLRSRVERQVVQLARLTDDLLDVARLTQGKVRLERAPVDLRAVVETAVEGCRPTLAERRQELVVRLPERPVTVDGDAARLEQVVAALLANASKYSPEGSHAWIALTREEGEAVLAVRDDGMGLAADFLPYAFEPFTQSERGADRAAGGLGLGLALVRRVIELHGGRVGADSEGVGHGSTFTIRLPLHRNAPAAESGGESAEQSNVGPRRVLVVDDNRDARDSLAEWLRMQGHEVVTAANAEEALEKAREHRPEVGLLDIGLPGVDGYQLAELLRAELHGIQLVATSGYGQPEALERSRHAGFDLHLVKPLDLRALADAIDRG